MIKTHHENLLNYYTIYTFKFGITTHIPNTIIPDVQKSKTSLLP